MNIFYLHEDPVIAAKAQTNKHVVKMILESAQLLSTAHRILDGQHYIDASSGRKLQRWLHPQYENELYKATHFNHPCAIWVRESKENYIWLYKHFIALCQEYTKRYKRTHATQIKLESILANTPNNISNIGFTKPALAMPDQYIMEDAVQSYRNYYVAEKLLSTEDKKRYEEILDEKIL